jgi:hypothetical protein
VHRDRDDKKRLLMGDKMFISGLFFRCNRHYVHDMMLVGESYIPRIELTAGKRARPADAGTGAGAVAVAGAGASAGAGAGASASDERSLAASLADAGEAVFEPDA